MSELYDTIQLIAPISDYEIDEMLSGMRPAQHLRAGMYQEIDIKDVHPRRQSYEWNPKLIGQEFTCSCLGKAAVPTFHTYGAPSLFKPSLAEVLAAIRRYCTAWGMVKFFALNCDLGSAAITGQYHRSECVLIAEPMLVGAGGILRPFSQAAAEAAEASA